MVEPPADVDAALAAHLHTCDGFLSLLCKIKFGNDDGPEASAIRNPSNALAWKDFVEQNEHLMVVEGWRRLRDSWIKYQERVAKAENKHNVPPGTWRRLPRGAMPTRRELYGDLGSKDIADPSFDLRLPEIVNNCVETGKQNAKASGKRSSQPKAAWASSISDRFVKTANDRRAKKLKLRQAKGRGQKRCREMELENEARNQEAASTSYGQTRPFVDLLGTLGFSAEPPRHFRGLYANYATPEFLTEDVATPRFPGNPTPTYPTPDVRTFVPGNFLLKNIDLSRFVRPDFDVGAEIRALIRDLVDLDVTGTDGERLCVLAHLYERLVGVCLHIDFEENKRRKAAALRRACPQNRGPGKSIFVQEQPVEEAYGRWETLQEITKLGMQGFDVTFPEPESAELVISWLKVLRRQFERQIESWLVVFDTVDAPPTQHPKDRDVWVV